MTKKFAFLALAATIVPAIFAGCAIAQDSAERYTLYRNSPLDRNLRVHWATFDVSGTMGDANHNQCEMTALLLNANYQTDRFDRRVGFWCEAGAYAEKGEVPSSFEGEFPTGVRTGPRL